MKIVPTPPTEEGYQLCLKFDDQARKLTAAQRSHMVNA